MRAVSRNRNSLQPSKNSLFKVQGTPAANPCYRDTFRDQSWSKKPLTPEVVPAKLPVRGEFSLGDRLEPNCIHHHAVPQDEKAQNRIRLPRCRRQHRHQFRFESIPAVARLLALRPTM